MKKLRLLIFIIPFICLFQIHAQTETTKDVLDFREDYNRNAIWAKGQKFIKNNEKLSYKEFIHLLSTYEESKIELSSYLKHRKTDNILKGIGVASLIASWIVLDENRDVAVGLGYTGAASLSVSAFFFLKGQNHLNKAAWHYNRESAINPN